MALLGGHLSLIRVGLALLGWMNDSLETKGTASGGKLGEVVGVCSPLVTSFSFEISIAVTKLLFSSLNT